VGRKTLTHSINQSPSNDTPQHVREVKNPLIYVFAAREQVVLAVGQGWFQSAGQISRRAGTLRLVSRTQHVRQSADAVEIFRQVWSQRSRPASGYVTISLSVRYLLLSS